MTSQHQTSNRSRLSELENWMVPILLGMILVVGAIRIFPWVKAKILPAEQVEVVNLASINTPTSQTNGEGSVIVSIDTSNNQILSAEEKVVTEQRSDQLAEILHQPPTPEPTLASIDTSSPAKVNTFVASAEPKVSPEPTPPKITVEPIISPPKVEIAEAKIKQPEVVPPAKEIAEITIKAASPEAVKIMSVEEMVRQAIVDWQVAWSSQDTDDYFAAYTDTYTDKKANRRTHKQWLDWRLTRVEKPDFIEIQISDVAINIANETKASARFVQIYRAPNYQDKVVKRLGLINIDDSWKIQSESTIKVLPL